MQIEERPLGESTRRLQAALDAAGMVAWEFDVSTGKLEVSACRGAVHTHFHFDERLFTAELLDHAIHRAGPYESEFRVVKPDGGIIWIRNQGEVIRDADGRPCRIIGIALDITERKESDELLRRITAGVAVASGEEFFKLLTQHLSRALKTDFACIGELVGPGANSVRTVSVYAIGRFWDEMEYQLDGTPCQKAVASGRCTYPQGVQSLFPQDRLLVDAAIDGYLGVALTSATGEPLGVMSVMHRSPIENVHVSETILNIFALRASAELERRRWERDLTESRNFMQRVAETAPSVIFVYDLIERRNVYANDRSVDIIGYTPREIEDMGEDFIRRLLHPDDVARLPQLGREYSSTQDGEIFEHVLRMKHKNGQWRWVHRCATVFTRTPDGRPRQILGSVTDITDLKRSERELQELSARLLKVQDEERRRIARELHDVTGQNIAAISLNLSILEKSDALDSNLRKITAACQRLCQDSAREIRTLSYLLFPPMLEQFGLDGALRWYVDGFVERSEIRVVLDIKPDIGRFPVEMETDLFRVVQEGLTNIMRHSGSKTAVIRLEKQDSQLTLQIEDSGYGLRAKENENFGVGIRGMHERLRKHGGSLNVRFTGQGSTLTAVIPLAPGDLLAKAFGETSRV